MNCLAVEHGGEILVVDCGVTFPEVDLGVDVFHPRFDWLLDRADRVRGVFLTHGHEDHVGALPYLLADLPVPVFGPPLALELVRRRLAEHDFEEGEVDLRPVRTRASVRVGGFDVEPIRVSHSTPDATALAIRAGRWTALHTGDFRMQADADDPERTDEERLQALGREGVHLLLSDSTNVDKEDDRVTEGDVRGALERLVERAPARVVVTLFASNVARVAAALAAARRTGRRVLLLGRSVGAHVAAAERTGWLRGSGDLLVSLDEAARIPRERLLVVASGSQAEPRSALGRLAVDAHPALRLHAGDVVVLSSRVIPGNDRAVARMVDELLRRGVDVVSRLDEPSVHASGHASRSEQERMIELVTPGAFLPLHGTLHHLRRHGALARDMGVASVVVAENGDVVDLGDDGRLEKSGTTRAGRVAAAFGEEVSAATLEERAQLARAGVVAVSLVRGADGRLAAPARAVERGALEEWDWELLRDVERAAAGAAASLGPKADEDALREAARLAARRVVERETGRRPLVVVLVAEAGKPPRSAP